jgi:hypothetical protein
MKATHPPTITPVSDPMRPSALLRCAASYIEINGRTTGEFFDMLSDRPFPPACAGGAIGMAAHGRPVLCSDDDTDDAASDAAITAMRVFAAHLDGDYAAGDHTVSAIDIIGAFNDNPHTTDTDVVLALHEAAEDWDRAHHTGGAR